MRVVDLVKALSGARWDDDDGDAHEIRALPPSEGIWLDQARRRHPAGLPAEVSELLGFAAGLDDVPYVDEIYFDGRAGGFEHEAFPAAWTLAGDGYGNVWFVDVAPTSGAWGPVLFFCHDPPVVVHQAADLGSFLELLRSEDAASPIDAVHTDHVDRIWKRERLPVPVRKARASDDPVIRQFAATLSDGYAIADLRRPHVGDGFAWARSAPIGRHPTERIFALPPRG